MGFQALGFSFPMVHVRFSWLLSITPPIVSFEWIGWWVHFMIFNTSLWIGNHFMYYYYISLLHPLPDSLKDSHVVLGIPLCSQKRHCTHGIQSPGKVCDSEGPPYLEKHRKRPSFDSLLANAKVLRYLESTNFGRSNAFNSAWSSSVMLANAARLTLARTDLSVLGMSLPSLFPFRTVM